MASNSFGNIFKITTWGESHGPSIGVVIDGCPAGLSVDEEGLNADLKLRSPGLSCLTSSRKEEDKGEILSGVFKGFTTGAPISILIHNKDTNLSSYEPIKEMLRPGHANYTYLEKYGVFDYRGGGRASARETACRVAAGYIAKEFLKSHNIFVLAYIKQIGSIKTLIPNSDIKTLHSNRLKSPLFCPDTKASTQMEAFIQEIKNEGDSIGGLVEFMTSPLPTGLGDPVYQKLEANLAYAMMSLPASKGFEIGEGFNSLLMKGSSHNDLFELEKKKVVMHTNHSGGTLGGISNGNPIIGTVVFKPPSSIMKPQKTVDLEGKASLLKLPENSRHDPCVAIRAVPVVEAMLALVLSDAILLNRCARL